MSYAFSILFICIIYFFCNLFSSMSNVKFKFNHTFYTIHHINSMPNAQEISYKQWLQVWNKQPFQFVAMHQEFNDVTYHILFQVCASINEDGSKCHCGRLPTYLLNIHGNISLVETSIQLFNISVVAVYHMSMRLNSL